MTFFLTLLAAATASVATPSAGDENTSNQGSEPVTAQQPEKICRQVALQAGTRKKEKLCLTAKEWRELNLR